MLIGIISDTHDNSQNLVKAVKFFNNKKVDMVIHCGDWASPGMIDFFHTLKLRCKTISVFGNNDGDKMRYLTRKEKNRWNIEFYQGAAEIKIEGKKLAIYHGDTALITNALINSQEYDVVLTGHDHVSLIEKKGETLHINPGSTNVLRDGRDDNPVTIAVYDTSSNKAKIIRLDK